MLEPRLLRADKTGMGTLRDKPGPRRFLRRTPHGLLRVDKTAIAREGGPDGKVAATHQRRHARPRWPGGRLQAAAPDRMLGESPNRRVAGGSRTG